MEVPLKFIRKRNIVYSGRTVQPLEKFTPIGFNFDADDCNKSQWSDSSFTSDLWIYFQ